MPNKIPCPARMAFSEFNKLYDQYKSPVKIRCWEYWACKDSSTCKVYKKSAGRYCWVSAANCKIKEKHSVDCKDCPFYQDIKEGLL